MTKLTKSISRTYTAGTSGVPADPGSPGTPAYSYEITETVAEISPPPGGHFIYKTPNVGDPSSGWVWIPGSGSPTIKYVTHKRTVFVPAAPPRPPTPGVAPSTAQTASDLNFGWNAGARSINPLTGDGVFTFKTDILTMGIVAGLNDVSNNASDWEIDYAFRCVEGLWSISERGLKVGPIGGFNSATVFGVARRGQTIYYTVNDETVYTSTVPAPLSDMVADSSIFAGGDYIDAAHLQALAGSTVVLPTQTFTGGANLVLQPVGLFAGDATGRSGQAVLSLQPLTLDVISIVNGDAAPAFAIMDGVMPPVTLSSLGVVYDAMLIPTLGLFAADRALAQGVLSMEPAQGSAGVGLLVDGWAELKNPAYTLAAAGTALSPNAVHAVARGQLTAFGGASAALRSPGFDLTATGAGAVVARAKLTYGSMALSAHGLVGALGKANVAVRLSALKVTGYSGAVARLVAPRFALDADGLVEGTGRARLTAPLVSLDAEGAAQNYGRAVLKAPGFFIPAVARGRLVLQGFRLHAVGGALVQTTYEAYAINLDPSAAEKLDPSPDSGNEVTHYTNFPFNQIVRFGKDYYAATDAGLFKLGGDDDAGAAIAWEFETHKTDFESVKKKSALSLYVGGRIGPEAVFRMIASEDPAGDTAYNYTNPRGGYAQTYRQRFGKGTKARYFAFGMADATGGDLTIDTLDPEYVVLKRGV